MNAFDIVIPPKHELLREIAPYFDDLEWMFDLDQENLENVYCEIFVYRYQKVCDR